MVMYPEIRTYQEVNAQMLPDERAEMSAQIMKSFQEKGDIPGAYKILWSTYQRRLKVYKNRKMAAQEMTATSR